MDTPNPRYLEERNRVLVGNLPNDFLRFDEGNQVPSSNGYSQQHHAQMSQQYPQQHPSQMSQQYPQQQPSQMSQQYPQQHPSQMSQHHPQQPAAAQPNVTQITITIVQAELTKNYSLTKMDPYVKIRIGHCVYETHTATRAGKFPRWNKVVSSYLDPGIKTVHFEIFDECTLTPDERIAYADFVIPNEVLQGNVFDESIPLSGKQGPDKEGFLNITMQIKSVPYWSTVSAAPTLMVTPPMTYYSRYNQQYRRPDYYSYQQPLMGNIVYSTIQQPPPQPPYQPSEVEVKQLKEMFPTFDDQVISGVLENCHGNKDQAITSLLSLSEK